MQWIRVCWTSIKNLSRLATRTVECRTHRRDTSPISLYLLVWIGNSDQGTTCLVVTHRIPPGPIPGAAYSVEVSLLALQGLFEIKDQFLDSSRGAFLESRDAFGSWSLKLRPATKWSVWFLNSVQTAATDGKSANPWLQHSIHVF